MSEQNIDELNIFPLVRNYSGWFMQKDPDPELDE